MSLDKKKQPIMLIREEEQELFRGNFISVGSDGCEVHSTTEPLEKVEACINRLIKKHRKFMLEKKKNKIILGTG
ncbi:MAG: hypothetical protein ABIH63_04380 [archaeon]